MAANKPTANLRIVSLFTVVSMVAKGLPDCACLVMPFRVSSMLSKVLMRGISLLKLGLVVEQKLTQLILIAPFGYYLATCGRKVFALYGLYNSLFVYFIEISLPKVVHVSSLVVGEG